VSGLGSLINASQVQVSDTSAAQAKKYSVDAVALSTNPCKLDIVLLPFDEDKVGPEDWQHFEGINFLMRAAPTAVDSIYRTLPTSALPCCKQTHQQLVH